MMSTGPSPKTKLARYAVSAGFLVNGGIYGMLACRLPDIQHRLSLDDGQLGTALMLCSFGSLFGVANGGRLSNRQGSHRVVMGMGIAFSCLIPFLAWAPSYLALIAVFVLFGFCGATMDVAMNVNGVAVEKELPKPIMSSLHGMWSLGGFISAGVGWLVVRGGVSAFHHFLFGGMAMVTIVLVASRFLLPATPSGEDAPAFVIPDRPVLLIGLICLCAFLCEGAMGDWSAIYLRQVLHQTPSFSTLGYFAFAFVMTSTRFFGDSILHRWGPSVTMRTGSAIALVGMAAGLLSGIPIPTIIGFACVGFGMATVAPIGFSLAGKVGGENPDHAIASVATMGYSAFLIGPAAIGWIAKATSLRAAMSVIVLLCFAILVLSSRVRDS